MRLFYESCNSEAARTIKTLLAKKIQKSKLEVPDTLSRRPAGLGGRVSAD